MPSKPTSRALTAAATHDSRSASRSDSVNSRPRRVPSRAIPDGLAVVTSGFRRGLRAAFDAQVPELRDDLPPSSWTASTTDFQPARLSGP